MAVYSCRNCDQLGLHVKIHVYALMMSRWSHDKESNSRLTRCSLRPENGPASKAISMPSPPLSVTLSVRMCVCLSIGVFVCLCASLYFCLCLFVYHLHSPTLAFKLTRNTS